jgi:hypothetical protein
MGESTEANVAQDSRPPAGASSTSGAAGVVDRLADLAFELGSASPDAGAWAFDELHGKGEQGDGPGQALRVTR